jgi:PHD/YefM family antitoxin component YafN of YafNO toxin-antitoxin module
MTMKQTLKTLVMLLSLFSASCLADYVVIANASLQVDDIQVSQLERLYLAKSKVLGNGDPVVVVDREKGQLRSVFYQQVVKRTEKQLRYYWSRMMFSGNARPPKKLTTDREVVRYVRFNKQAIGYISQEAYDSGQLDLTDIKVLDLQ